MVSDEPNSKPLVVLDCANIGWLYGADIVFDPEGIERALAFFRQRDVEVVAFIPSSYMKKKPRGGGQGNACMETDTLDTLQRLVRTGAVAAVPAGDHDDVYILSYARHRMGYVVSNDHFADHLQRLQVDSLRTSMALWLRTHRCGYTFVDGEFVPNPGCALAVLLGHGGSANGAVASLTAALAAVLHGDGQPHQQQQQHRQRAAAHVMLARALCLAESNDPGTLTAAAADLQLVLEMDPGCVEAAALLQHCTAMTY